MRTRTFKMILLIALSATLASCSLLQGNDKAPLEREVDYDPFGRYEEPITVRIGTIVDDNKPLLPGETLLDNQYTRNIKENLNIDIEYAFKTSKENYTQTVQLAIAINDIPDAFIVGPNELRELYESDQIKDLTEVYHHYASPVIKKIIDGAGDVAIDSVTFDGKIMAFPNVQLAADGIHLLWIRKDWLEKLNLSPPSTIEELVQTARAFVEQDPDQNGIDDTVGLAGPGLRGKLYGDYMNSTNILYGFDGIFAAFGAYPGYWLERDGDIIYGSTAEETKQALSLLRDMYAQGLIDSEISVRQNSDTLVVDGKVGMFFGPWWMPYASIGDAIKKDQTANWQAYALPLDRNGSFSPHMSTPTTQFVVVNKKFEHPEAVMKIINNHFLGDSRGTFTTERGPTEYPLRLTYAPWDETEFEVKALREVLVGNKTHHDFVLNTEYKLLYTDAQNIKKVKLEPYDQYDIQYWKPENDWAVWIRSYALLVGGSPLVDNKINGVYSVTYSQTETMKSRWEALENLEYETFLSIILGAAPIDVFDSFVDEWNKRGGEQIIEEINQQHN